MMVRLDDLEVLMQAVGQGSLSAAARSLGITPAVASVAIKRLEQALGARLLVRSTRSLRLTPEGSRYLVHARAALGALEHGAQELRQGRQQIRGELCLSMPSDLGRNLLLGWLDDFMAEHPQLSLRLRVSDRLSDLISQPVDIALRYGIPEDSSLVALPLCVGNRRLVCASPAYLERHGIPHSPEALRQHNCLCFVLEAGVYDRWKIGDGRVKVQGNRISDDADCVRRWAVAGLGVAYKSALDIHTDLQAGRLVSVLVDHATEPLPLYLVCPHRLSLSPAVVALKDFLAGRLGKLGVGALGLPTMG